MLPLVVKVAANPVVPRFASIGGTRAVVNLAKIVGLNIQNHLPPLPLMLLLDSGVGGDAVPLVPEPLGVLENVAGLDPVHVLQEEQGNQVGTNPVVGHGHRAVPGGFDRHGREA